MLSSLLLLLSTAQPYYAPEPYPPLDDGAFTGPPQPNSVDPNVQVDIQMI